MKKSVPSAACYVPAILYYVCKLFYDFRRWMHDPAILDYCFCLFALICFMIATYHAASFSFDHGGRRRLCFYSLWRVLWRDGHGGQDLSGLSSTAQARACVWPMPCRRSETANNPESRKSSANLSFSRGNARNRPLRIERGKPQSFHRIAALLISVGLLFCRNDLQSFRFWIY